MVWALGELRALEVMRRGAGWEKKPKQNISEDAVLITVRNVAAVHLPPPLSLAHSPAASALQTGVCNEGFPAFRRLRRAPLQAPPVIKREALGTQCVESRESTNLRSLSNLSYTGANEAVISRAPRLAARAGRWMGHRR